MKFYLSPSLPLDIIGGIEQVIRLDASGHEQTLKKDEAQGIVASKRDLPVERREDQHLVLFLLPGAPSPPTVPIGTQIIHSAREFMHLSFKKIDFRQAK